MSKAIMKKASLLVAAIAGAGLFATTSNVQAQELDSPNSGKISFAAGADVSTHYVFRGIVQENQGLIFQPWGEGTANLFEGEGFVNRVDLTIGGWASFQSAQTGRSASGFDDSYYEQDIYAGLTFGLGDNWEAGVVWTAYTSPSDAFGTVQEVALSIAYDDTGKTPLDFALNPYALVAFEYDSSVDGQDTGTYLELGVEPSWVVMESADYPVTLSVPVTIGLSIDNYYEDPSDGDDDTFGFASVGAMFSIPLSSIPSDYGSWTLSAGPTFYWIGDNAGQLGNAAGGDGDNFEVQGTIGISMTY